MSAKVDKMFLCPKCNHGISAPERPPECPGCKYKFRSPSEGLTEEFHWPKSPDEQFFEIIQQDMEKFLDKPLSEIAKELIPGVKIPEEMDEATLSNEKRLELIKKFRSKQRDQFFMNTTPKEIEGWFKCLHYLMTLGIPSGNKELALQMARMGREIGKIAKSIEKYVEHGGRFYEHKITTKGSDERNP